MKTIQVVKVLAALAQESRLEVFRRLVRCGEKGMAAGRIAEKLDIPPATLSFHLKELTNAGLIGQHREGRSIIYSLNVQAMRSLFGYLMNDCCQGRPELCQPDFTTTECCGPPNSKKSRRRQHAKAK